MQAWCGHLQLGQHSTTCYHHSWQKESNKNIWRTPTGCKSVTKSSWTETRKSSFYLYAGHHGLCESKNLIGSLGIGYLLIDHQPSQNVLAAGHLAVYNEISAAYFCRFLPEALAASPSAAYYYSQLAYYSETFWLGWTMVASKSPSKGKNFLTLVK